MKEWVDFRAVKEAVSLEAVLHHYQVAGLRRRGSQLEGGCPIHRGKRDDSFRASLSKNVFHCFACQASGNVLDFVAALEKCSIRQAALRLQQWFGVGQPGSRVASPQRVAGSVRGVGLVREKKGAILPCVSLWRAWIPVIPTCGNAESTAPRPLRSRQASTPERD